MLALFFIDPYFWLTIPGMLLALWAQFRLSSMYGRYSRVAAGRGLTGAEAARYILDRNGLTDIDVHEVPGHLSDHYDPSKRAVFLSSENYRNPSLAAVGVAAHEVGHAIQHGTQYACGWD
jgi:Zn-dependent membrane protease YugP